MPLSAEQKARVEAEAKRRGVDPAAAIAEAEKRSGPEQSVSSDTSDPKAERPVADRLLIGFLPFIKVRELRSIWLGLDERIADDELTCAEYQVKHGATAPSTPEGDD
jgi:hypothetical protein